MTVPEPRSRDLSSLRIERDKEKYDEGSRVGRYLGYLVALLALLIAGYFAYVKVVVPRRAPVVETAIVKPSINESNPPLLTATGYLVADRQAKITPKISGKVIRLNADTGMTVRKGDVLAVLESTNLQALLDEANANLAEAEREYRRQKTLWAEGVTSRAQLDSAEAAEKAALARVDGVRINMNDMVVRAPFDGTIATKNTEVGEVISSVALGTVAGTLPAGAICTLVDLSTLKVVADVNESNISQLREGQPAEVTVDAFPGQKWKGMLTQIIPTADRAKAVVQVKVAILNPSARLLPEMSASASFLQAARTDAELQEKPKIWLPAAAIVDGHVAIVDAANRVHLKPVTTGATRDGRVEVTAGLTEGQKIVTDKVEELKDGDLVRNSEA